MSPEGTLHPGFMFQPLPPVPIRHAACNLITAEHFSQTERPPTAPECAGKPALPAPANTH
jgi:hypothetical protein